MKLTIKVLSLSLLAIVLALPIMAAEMGSAERGKELFVDPAFAGGSKACGNKSCHPAGRGLERAGGKEMFDIMGKDQDSLEEAVNFCIVNANKGNAIDEDSQDMKDIVAYIKTLGRPMSKSPGAY